MPTIAPAGAELRRQTKRWRGQFFTFMTERDVPPTNNAAERALRPSVIFRKVTNGFRSIWGADVPALVRSAIGTGRLNGLTPSIRPSHDPPPVSPSPPPDHPREQLLPREAFEAAAAHARANPLAGRLGDKSWRDAADVRMVVVERPAR